MDALGWTSLEPPGSGGTGSGGAIVPTGGGTEPRPVVRWRRRGGAAEVRLEQSRGARLARRPLVPPPLVPAASAVTWSGGTALVHAGGMGALVVQIAATGGDPLLIWLGAIVGAVATPVAGVAGYFSGRRRQRRALDTAAVEDDVADAVTVAFGRDVRGPSGRALVRRTMEALRRGHPQRAVVRTSAGVAEYRIDPVAEDTVQIVPLSSPAAESSASSSGSGSFGRFVRSIPDLVGMGATAPVTQAAEQRMADLERRLDAVASTGLVAPDHASYPAFVILQVDRITEFRSLAVRAQRVAEVGTPEARATAERLVADLDEVVDLMAVGVEALERLVLADSKRQSDVHVAFLREKYRDDIRSDSFGEGTPAR